MKLLFFFTLTLSVFLNCKKPETIKVVGSETMHSSMNILGNEFQKKNSSYIITVSGGGSEEGLNSLRKGVADLAAVSREVSLEELNSLGENVKTLLIAYDGAAIVVNPSNPITNINLEKAHLVFSGKINNWKELGGDDLPIQLVIRNDHSGTAKYFKEHVLHKKDLGQEEFEKNRNLEFPNSAKEVKDNIEMGNFIKENRGAIGFMGMGSVKENLSKVKTLHYARKKEDFVEPTIKNVLDRKYRLSRGLYLLYAEKSEPKIGSFLNFILSEEGQKSILNSGYLRSTLQEVEVKANEK